MMNFKTYFALASVVSSLAVGQILFKSAAIQWHKHSSLFSSQTLVRLMPALIIYALATVAWIWVLQKVSLNVAYPYMALAFVIVPLGSYVFLGETTSLGYWLGSLLIVTGVIVTSLSK